MPEKGSGDAKKLVLTFEVSVLDKGGDGWEARCDDGDLHLTGVESQKLLVEKVREHFLRIGDEMGPAGERVLFNLVLDCPDPDAAPTEAGAAETEPTGADAAESGAAAAEPQQDQHPGTKEKEPKPKGAAFRTSFAETEDAVEDLESRVGGLEDQVEDLQSRIDDLEGVLL